MIGDRELRSEQTGDGGWLVFDVHGIAWGQGPDHATATADWWTTAGEVLQMLEGTALSEEMENRAVILRRWLNTPPDS